MVEEGLFNSPEFVYGIIFAGIFLVMGLLIQIGGSLFSDWRNHKRKIKFLKIEFIFKEKISIFEKVGGLSWKNHFALTTIENMNKLKRSNEKNLEIIKQELNSNLIEFAVLLNKIIYFSGELRKNLGGYIREFEEYINDKDFGKEGRTKELRERYKPFMYEIDKIILKELEQIK